MTISSDDLSTVKAYLTNKGITVVEKEGDPNHASKGKVQKVVISANGQTKELGINSTWTTNLTGASAEIYVYKEATISLTRTETDTTIKFATSLNGADGADSYSWYLNGNESALSDKNGSSIEFEKSDSITSIKVVAHFSDGTNLETTWNS